MIPALHTHTIFVTTVLFLVNINERLAGHDIEMQALKKSYLLLLTTDLAEPKGTKADAIK